MKSLIINKKDLLENIKKIKDFSAENCTIIGVVKGNGYGFGLIEYSKILIENKIEILAVATIDEAIKLRKELKSVEILNMSTTAIKEEVESLIENNITLTIGSFNDIDVLEAVLKSKNMKASVHLKLDTGFGRYGFIKEEKELLLKKLKELKNITLEGCFSNFASSYMEDKTYMNKQYNEFLEVTNFLKENEINLGMLHMCNSAAFLNNKEMHLDAIRIGSAFTGRLICENKLELKKIGILKTNVSEVKSIKKDSCLGYSYTYKAKQDIKVAIVPVGFIDGINVNTGDDSFRQIDKIRRLYNCVKKLFKNTKINARINGKLYNVIGKIGLCHMEIDISNTDIKINDEVYIEVKPFFVDTEIRREYI